MKHETEQQRGEWRAFQRRARIKVRGTRSPGRTIVRRAQYEGEPLTKQEARRRRAMGQHRVILYRNSAGLSTYEAWVYPRNGRV